MVPGVLRPQQPLLQQLVKHLLHFQRRHLQHLAGHLHQPLVRHTGMPLVGPLEQRIVQPRLQPLLAELIKAHVLGQPVRRPKPDAFRIFRQTVRIVADPGNGRIAVQRLDFSRKIGTDSVTFQEKYQLPAVPQLPVGRHNPFRLLLADARHFPQPLRFLVQHLHGLVPKVLHNPLGHHRPHTRENPAAQHLDHGLGPRRRQRLPAGRLELPAKPRMLRPLSRQLHLLTCKRRLPLVHNGNGPHFPVFTPKNSKAAVSRLEHNILDSYL